MWPHLRPYIITAVIAFLVGGFAVYKYTQPDVEHYESQFEKFKERQAERDSLMAMQSRAIQRLRSDRTKYLIKYYRTKQELDSTFVRMEKLTEVKVTDEDKTEALQWIELHNNSLGQ